jgi:hypothetical protein
LFSGCVTAKNYTPRNGNPLVISNKGEALDAYEQSSPSDDFSKGWNPGSTWSSGFVAQEPHF